MKKSRKVITCEQLRDVIRVIAKKAYSDFNTVNPGVLEGLKPEEAPIQLILSWLEEYTDYEIKLTKEANP